MNRMTRSLKDSQSRAGSGWAYNQYTRVGGGIFTLLCRTRSFGEIQSKRIKPSTPRRAATREVEASVSDLRYRSCLRQSLRETSSRTTTVSRNSGGINIAGPCIIQDNVIQGNATGTGDGGGLYLIGNVGRVIIRRNLIVENHAADHGGGLYLANVFGGNPELIEVSGNVIIGNEALGAHGKNYCPGGGIWIAGGANVHHNTVAFNIAETTAAGLSGGGCCLLETLPGTLVEYNILYKKLGRWDRLRRPFHRPAVPKSPIRQQPIRHRTP